MAAVDDNIEELQVLDDEEVIKNRYEDGEIILEDVDWDDINFLVEKKVECYRS